MRHLAALLLATAGATFAGEGGAVDPYIDPQHQNALWFGARSHWVQPWRAYLETPPATDLTGAIGINLNIGADQADAVCRHLASHGFVSVRVEIGWGRMGWEPGTLVDTAHFDTVLGACRKHGLRPLFLLNAHHGAPCPHQFWTAHLVAPAAAGATTVRLDAASAKQITPGRSGLNQLTDYWAAECLFTAVADDGTATLSKPLPKDLPAGDASACTLKYLPFYPQPEGGPLPPEAIETLDGWIDYVRTIGAHAERVLGTADAADSGFDLEVWNELTFGSNFLDVNHYVEPDLPGEWIIGEILRRTVAFVRDPANGFARVGISDGFNNQWPWGAGSSAPPGLTALGKHPYAGMKRFPDPQAKPNGIRPVDALFRAAGTSLGQDEWQDDFVPTYVSHFPEYGLNAIQTEHLIRELSPFESDIYGTKHGRRTHPLWPDGTPAPAPTLWITEVNLDPNGADPGDLQAYTRGGAAPVAPGLTPADADRMKAKAVLRYLVSYTNKGPAKFWFFAAHDGNPLGLGLVANAFVDAAHGSDPGDEGALTSPTMAAIRRLVAIAAPQPIAAPRALMLERIEDDHGHRQFDGDPRTVGQDPNPYPPLYNRDCVAFFPFQSSDRRLVVATYVMTRNLARLYHPAAAADDATRFDLPPERYRLTLTGVKPTATIALHDALDGVAPVPVVVKPGAKPETVVIEVDLTDAPKLLVIDD